MAYPDRIKTDGPLSQQDDIFEYFKGALLAQYDDFFDPERWPIRVQSSVYYKFPNSTGTGVPTPIFPIFRSEFYSFIDTWTSPERFGINTCYYFGRINTFKLYEIDWPQSNWSWEMLNDWAKVKSAELAIFGTVGNGGDLSASSIFQSGTILSSVPNWTICDMTYLRFALARFDYYGACHPESYQNPSPSNPVENTGARTFNWTNAPGFINVSDYEYSINESNWATVPSKPLSVPSGQVGPGGLLLRTKGVDYINPSMSLFNELTYP